MAKDVLTFEKMEIDCDFRDINGNKYIGAKIIINGDALLDKVTQIETKYATTFKDRDEPQASVGGYQHQVAEILHKYLTNTPFENKYGGVAIFTCTCLEDGCWCIRCIVDETDSEVVWNNFQHEHREKWDYSELEFHFDKNQYYKELDHLKSFMGSSLKKYI